MFQIGDKYFTNYLFDLDCLFMHNILICTQSIQNISHIFIIWFIYVQFVSIFLKLPYFQIIPLTQLISFTFLFPFSQSHPMISQQEENYNHIQLSFIHVIIQILLMCVNQLQFRSINHKYLKYISLYTILLFDQNRENLQNIWEIVNHTLLYVQ